MQAFMRFILPTALAGLVLFLGACSDSNVVAHDTVPGPVRHEVSYTADIEPIIEQKCLACHGCYDAPCQLKFETPEGLERGAHKQEVYNGSRLRAANTTRLGYDAHTEEEWRDLGFYSVLETEDNQPPLLKQMLELGKQYEFEPNSRLPNSIKIGLARTDQCVSPGEFASYAQKHPYEGMPLGTTGLTDKEYALINAWIDQGAVIEHREIKLSGAEKRAIQQWENWLNRPAKEQQLVSRWVYEHLYLARLHFSDINAAGTTNYFEIVRSHTPSGSPIELISTRRPNDDPKGKVYYRLRVVDETVVHKRHITFALNSAKQKHMEQMFFTDEPWHIDKLPGYSAAERANPFGTFAAIPARARYQFMLDDAEYFTRTFIRGPVCRGQIATDVIRDRFWAFFVAPEKDIFITNEQHRQQATPLLALAGQNGKLTQAGSEWLSFKRMRNDYLKLREEGYQALQPEGPSLDDAWDGDGHNQEALLTIFRHHDSASVEKGWIGAIPTTIWWMDYPLFERTYYQLVVNFDVFGNIAHQLQTRLYFDLIRNGSEQSFLRLMPPNERQPLLHDWYQKLGKVKLAISYEDVDTTFPTAENFITPFPKDELAVRALDKFASINAMQQDPINRCEGKHCGRTDVPNWITKADRSLATLASRPFDGLRGLKHLPETTFLRVTHANGERTVYTLIRNRFHKNVAFLFGEKRRYDDKQDTLTVYPGIIGSYPNFIFSVDSDELENFTQQLAHAKRTKTFRSIVARWGVRRTHTQFWDILADIQAWHKEERPLQAGIFDINRYENL